MNARSVVFSALFLSVSLGLFGPLAPTKVLAVVTLSNPSTTLDVYGGEAGNALIPYGGYFRYTDLVNAEETTWSIDPVLIVGGTAVALSNGPAGGFGSPIDLGGGMVGSAGGAGNIAVGAITELIGTNARTTFFFNKVDLSGPDLDGSTFVFYAENDLFSFGDDAAVFTGSIAGGDLTLFQFDTLAGGLTVKMTGENLGGAPLVAFGSGLWTGFGSSIEASDLSVLSADGSNFVPSGDLGLALAFALTGEVATVQVDYDTQPETPIVPEPAALVLLVLGASTMALVRSSRQ